MTFTIEPARPADLVAVSRLAGELMRLHHELDRERFMLAPGVEQGYQRFLSGLLGNPETVVLVAHVEGEVVGYVYARMEPRDWNLYLDASGHLHDVYVDLPHRRRGIARALLQAAIAALFDKGAPRVLLNTASRNEEAQRLFASLGFRNTMLEMARERD